MRLVLPKAGGLGSSYKDIMNITINGTSQQIASTIDLSVLVQTFCPQSRHVLTELNGVIIPHDQRSDTFIKEGDVLELVAFVGGG